MFVPKKESGLKLYIDYRGLNVIIIKNRTPLSLISKIFIKFDLKDMYYKLRIRGKNK
jgi:hypothetical protein